MSNPFLVTRNDRKTDDFGITTMRSGQYIGMSLLDSIQAAYTNLVYKPVAFALLIFLAFMVAAELNNASGPVEEIISTLQKIIADVSETMLLRNIASFLLIIFTFIAKYKLKFVCIGLMIFPYLAKPSRSNMIISSILILFVMFGKHSFWEVLLLSQCFFLYTELRTPWHKMMFIIIGIALFLVGLEFTNKVFGLSKLVSNPPTTTYNPSSSSYSAPVKNPK